MTGEHLSHVPETMDAMGREPEMHTALRELLRPYGDDHNALARTLLDEAKRNPDALDLLVDLLPVLNELNSETAKGLIHAGKGEDARRSITSFTELNDEVAGELLDKNLFFRMSQDGLFSFAHLSQRTAERLKESYAFALPIYAKVFEDQDALAQMLMNSPEDFKALRLYLKEFASLNRETRDLFVEMGQGIHVIENPDVFDPPDKSLAEGLLSNHQEEDLATFLGRFSELDETIFERLRAWAKGQDKTAKSLLEFRIKKYTEAPDA